MLPRRHPAIVAGTKGIHERGVGILIRLIRAWLVRLTEGRHEGRRTV